MTSLVLDAETWRARQEAHQHRVERWIAPVRDRRDRGEKHPVEDFLFDYYSYRPSQLRRWHPGHGIVLSDAGEFLSRRDYYETFGGVTVDTEAVLNRRRSIVEWVTTLLRRTSERSAQFGCFGMHEWAMVYRQSTEDIRHSAWPMRFSPEKIASIVDERGVRCSHFDAFRFFTEPARPLNVLQPTRESQSEFEQGGCLHANMDLYKWAYKLSPLVGSELIADCFALARDIRELDMRASPYDLSALGYQPVAVETVAGRTECVAAQREFADRAAPLRQRLLTTLDSALQPSADECPLPAESEH